MNDKLLYFPYIDIPKSSWTIKSILYWDEVGIIVPPAYAEDPVQYDPFTLDLLHTDLVNQIFPDNFIREVPRFDAGFLELVNNPRFNIERRRIDFNRNLWTRIHIQKFGDVLLDNLVELGIARRQNYQWYRVESKTARLIMLYLASAIGLVGNYTPATDEIKNLDRTMSQRGSSVLLSRIRQNLIDDLIPYPIDPDLTALRRFKEQYYEELKSFRILIEQAAFDISISRPQHQETKRKLKIEEINDKREKILSELNQSNLGRLAFGTICGAAGTVVGYLQQNSLLGMFSLASGLHSAFSGYNKKATLSKDFSYLALIDSRLKHKK